MPRASDQLRESTVALLGRGYAEGMLGFETLCRRVDRAYAARSADQLHGLVRDLPLKSTWAVRELWGRVVSLVAGPPAGNAAPLLAPPVSDACRYSVGRGEANDLHIEVATISRRHAVLEQTGERWTIEDLGSSNGTFVNDWRVSTPTVVEPGDSVRLADITWVFAPRS